jgi:hypothetical protein
LPVTTNSAAKHETQGDDRQLHDGLALEPQAVGGGQGEIRRHDEHEAPGPEHGRAREADRDERNARADGDRGGKLAARHGPQTLDRVMPVLLRVEHVVDEVVPRGGGAEEEERHDDAPEHRPVAEDAGRRRRREDEDVLRPLARAHRPHEEPGCAVAPVGRLVAGMRRPAPVGFLAVVLGALGIGHAITWGGMDRGPVQRRPAGTQA